MNTFRHNLKTPNHASLLQMSESPQVPQVPNAMMLPSLPLKNAPCMLQSPLNPAFAHAASQTPIECPILTAEAFDAHSSQ